MNILNKFWEFTNLYRTSISSEKYTPYGGNNLAWDKYRLVANTNPIVSKCIRLRDKNVNANGYTVTCSMYRSEERNNQVEKAMYKMLDEMKWNQLVSQATAKVSTFGNCFFVVNNDGQIVIHEPDLYNIYWSRLQGKATRYALVKDGREMTGEFGNLQQGVDIYHVKPPAMECEPLAPSPIDACMEWVMYYLHAIQANNQLASRGWINTLLFPSENNPNIQNQLEQKDNDGRTLRESIIERLRSVLGGSRNAGSSAILPAGILPPIEIGKTNQEMQYTESIQVVIEQIALAYGFSMSDLGKDVTYNNAKNFDYAQYDIFGREFENILRDVLLTFAIPNFVKSPEVVQAIQDGRIDFKFNEPKNPDEVVALEADIKVLQAQATLLDAENTNLVINEFRNKHGLEPLEFTIEEALQQAPQIEANYRQINFSTVTQTPTEIALASREYERETASGKKGFRPHLEGKIEQQLNDFTKKKA